MTNSIDIKAKLAKLKTGIKIIFDGKLFEVINANHLGGKLSRTDIIILEIGLPMYYEVAGRFLAAGTMIKMDNCKFITLYAQKSSDVFDIAEEN